MMKAKNAREKATSLRTVLLLAASAAAPIRSPLAARPAAFAICLASLAALTADFAPSCRSWDTEPCSLFYATAVPPLLIVPFDYRIIDVLSQQHIQKTWSLFFEVAKASRTKWSKKFC